MELGHQQRELGTGRETDSHRSGRGEATAQRRNVVGNERMLSPLLFVGRRREAKMG